MMVVPGLTSSGGQETLGYIVFMLDHLPGLLMLRPTAPGPRSESPLLNEYLTASGSNE